MTEATPTRILLADDHHLVRRGVRLILDGEPLVEAGGLVAGVPIALPRVLVETVSAGGGSIGWVDEGGALRAGPRSAGAVPGPVAFGRGGTQPTVTDAHVALGNIAASHMSDAVRVDADADAGPRRQTLRIIGDRLVLDESVLKFELNLAGLALARRDRDIDRSLLAQRALHALRAVFTQPAHRPDQPVYAIHCAESGRTGQQQLHAHRLLGRLSRQPGQAEERGCRD